MQKPNSSDQSSRRDFLAASAIAGSTLALPGLLPGAYVKGDTTLRIGLIGCGGRGTGAATQALRADPNVKLVAMGDAFKDRIDSSLVQLKKDKAIVSKLDVSPENCFVGFDAYQKVIDSGVDVVLLCTPPHFRPEQLKATVEAGKHAFVEKPIAVDGPGVRSVLETCKAAKEKNLSIVSGLCYRYENKKRELMKRVHEGAVGDIVALHTSYNTWGLWKKDRRPDWTDMEWQLRNWLYFTWLSGDHIVEQHIHSLDKMLWAMQDKTPMKADGMGGRQVRTGKEYGHIFDHHAVVYEYENGVKLFSFCRQINGCTKDVNDYVMGTKGTANVMGHAITGENAWKHRRRPGDTDNMYQNEHNELFASIRSGTPINNGDYMCKSTLLAIMGRMATYTGKTVTWDEALESPTVLGPGKYDWDMKLEVPAIPMPGKS